MPDVHNLKPPGHRITLGMKTFRLVSQQQHLLSETCAVYSANAVSPAFDEIVINLDEPCKISRGHFDSLPAATDLSSSIQRVNDHVKMSHGSLLHLHASSLVDPSNHTRTIMIVGNSFAGKTTLSLAAAVSRWRLIAEDLNFLDADGSLVPLPLPVSLRSGTRDLVLHSTGIDPLPIIADRWVVRPDLYHKQPAPAIFSVAILLDKLDINDPGPLEILRVSPHKFLRSILSLSNALLIKDGTDRLFNAIESCTCMFFREGSLEQRLEALNS